MSSTTPKISELLDALPVEAPQDQEPAAALQTLLGRLSRRRVPTGRWNRLWTLGSLQAKIGAAYLAWWLREGYVGNSQRQRTLNETHLKAALQLLDGMTYLRGMVMKIGQVLATHPEAAPAEMAAVLGHLHFEAPPMHFSLLREFVRAELGDDPEEVFAEFETRAFAAASLGQVHRARLKGSNRKVAVKVQYPNIARTISADFRNMIALLAPMRLSGDWGHLKAQFDDVAEMLEQETDYRLEAENLKLVRTAFADDPGFCVPEVHPEFSSRRVLTMDLLAGPHLEEFLATDPAQGLRDEFGRKIAASLFRLQHSHRLVYADPQPGNYLFMPDGRLGLLDFGSCRHLDDEDVAHWADAERTFFTRPTEMRDVLARGSDLSEQQAADEVRMAFLQQWSDWAWEPIVHEGPFDFGDPDYFRRGAAMYGYGLRKRYLRTRPSNTWLIKCVFGLRAMLTRLGARVDMGEVHRQETRVDLAG